MGIHRMHKEKLRGVPHHPAAANYVLPGEIPERVVVVPGLPAGHVPDLPKSPLYEVQRVHERKVRFGEVQVRIVQHDLKRIPMQRVLQHQVRREPVPGRVVLGDQQWVSVCHVCQLQMPPRLQPSRVLWRYDQ